MRICWLLAWSVRGDDGIAYDSQNPRHALVVTLNLTHPGIVTVLVFPVKCKIKNKPSMLKLDLYDKNNLQIN